MYGDRFYAAHPNSFHQLMEDYLWQNGAGGDDQVIDFVEPSTDRDLALGPRAWVRPRPRWCPATGKGSCPRRGPTHRQVVLMPILVNSTDATPRNGRQYGRGAIVDAPRANGGASATDKNSLPRKQTGSPCSTCTVADAGNARDVSPWEFSAEMSGCVQVRAGVEGGMLIVEGQGSTDSVHKVIQYATPLPRHIRQDSKLTLRLNNGRATVTHEPEDQYLEGQAGPQQTEMKQQPQEKSPAAANRKDLQNTSNCMMQKQQKSCESPEQQQQKKATEKNKQ